RKSGQTPVRSSTLTPAVTSAGNPHFNTGTQTYSKWNPRGAEWDVWLLRRLIECGHCHLGCNCHRMRGRNGTWHRYYYCRGHDPLQTRSGMDRCPERNIRADELDECVFAQVRQALLDPRQLIAAERAVIAGTPADANELVAAQLNCGTQ
ncbi:MAG: recombinase zinc ribbon domain-containing protein, partial [Solirubrobacteraceae bacterium]